ncbi:MAG: redoxin domain-containing protein [Gemmatimonadota bacterium]
MSVRLRDRAPGFRLPCAPGEEVDVGELIGRETVVLLFFPLAFSPVCTREMCTFRDDWADWEALGARVFGITVDSPFVTRRFQEAEAIPFPILSDFNRDVSRSYGVLHEDLLGLREVTKRSVFVIDPEGRVAYAWVSDDPRREPEYEEVRDAVAHA